MNKLLSRLLTLFVSLAFVLCGTPLSGIALAEQGNKDAATEEGLVEEKDTTAKGGNANQSSSSVASNNDIKETSEQDDLAVEVSDSDAVKVLSANSLQAATVNSGDQEIDAIVNNMSLYDKISQMIMVAFRTWNNEQVKNLDKYDDLKEALRAHQYCGVVLFGQNVESAEQTGILVNKLQENNAQGRNNSIPYFVAADEEGGVVTRFTMGTRMTGSMAVGATGDAAANNAFTTGRILGEECAALGFNVDFAPSIDVNSNPANPAIGTRAFSDVPQTVSTLGGEFTYGLAQSNVIATLKHFPGAGDTSEDTHSSEAISNKTLAELNACELIPFREVIGQGNADMIMTAHVTLPKVAEKVDGKDLYYPATMSYNVLTGLLRNKIGFQGVVVTDALEMEALYKNGYVDGNPGDSAATASLEYRVNLAQKIIEAGADILLVPRDLTSSEVASFYNDYISALATKAQSNQNLMKRINESVVRILKLKNKFGFLKSYKQVDINKAKEIVGSDAHHEDELKIARKAITLVKNDKLTLPLSGHDNHVVFVTRFKDDYKGVYAAIKTLQDANLVDPNAYVNVLSSGQTYGNEQSKCHITIDYYYDSVAKALHYTDNLKGAIADADAVVGISTSYDTSPYQVSAPHYQALSRALAEAHAAGASFTLLANNLPYDAARYTDADAAVLCYMNTALDVDPTTRADGSANVGAFNANMHAAVQSLFDEVPPTGTLPVRIPTIVQNADGKVGFDVNTTLYERGTGLAYSYEFVEGAGGTHTKGTNEDLAFKNNARFDKLVRLEVDDNSLNNADYSASWGSTNILLKSGYLNKLEAGEHTLNAVYDYGELGGEREMKVSTNFFVKDTAVPALGITYDAHCENVGWKAPSGKNGTTAGTTGEGKRLEAMRISVDGKGVEYRTHVQNKGWEVSWARDGEVSGTTGKGLRVEAMQVRLNDGLAAKGYHVWYRVHSQNFGWLGWAKDGEPAGTTGRGLRAEAYEVVVLAGDDVPSTYKAGKTAYVSAPAGRAHVQNQGWISARSAGLFGTTGKGLRLESLRLGLGAQPYTGGIEYQSHVQNIGWEKAARSDGATSGTTGRSLRVEAVRMNLTGEAANHLSVWYRVHSQDYGWLGWTHDGRDAGTVGLSKRAEAVEVRILSKDAAAPGPTKSAFVTN